MMLKFIHKSLANRFSISVFLLIGIICFEAIVLYKSSQKNIRNLITNQLLNICNRQEQVSVSKPQCWEDLVEKVVEKRGVDDAMLLLADLYEKGEDFAENCHSYTHIVGSKAYFLFIKNGEIYTGSKASYCGYGFYHGFLETLVNTSGDFSKAREFCQKTAELSQLGSAWTACYHGIGHGVADGSDPRTWGDPEAMIKDALDMCEKVSKNDIQEESCASGVFNSLAIMYWSPKYKLTINKNDPFEICYKQKKDYILQKCFEEMNTLVARLADNDFSEAMTIASRIKDDKYAGYAVSALSTFAASFTKHAKNPIEFLDICHSLRPVLQLPCLVGFVAGLIEHGLPEKQHIAALDFCKSEKVSNEEKEYCFQALLRYGNHFFSYEKYRDLCGMVKDNYKYLCN